MSDLVLVYGVIVAGGLRLQVRQSAAKLAASLLRLGEFFLNAGVEIFGSERIGHLSGQHGIMVSVANGDDVA